MLAVYAAGKQRVHADSLELEPQVFTALVGGVEGKVWNEKHISPHRVSTLASLLTASTMMTYVAAMASMESVSQIGTTGNKCRWDKLI